MVYINLFGLSTDIDLGAQFDRAILTNDTLKQQYPLLDSVQYATAYGHLRRITDNILNSGKVVNRDKFAWRVRIIRDDVKPGERHETCWLCRMNFLF